MKVVRILVVVGAAHLVGCTPVVPKVTVADHDPLRRAVVEDVADGMNRMFEAADTVLVPSRTMAGPFDSALIAALRDKGFPVEKAVGRGAAFDCRVHPLAGNMYRVTVHVGETVLSRLWILKGTDAYSGGAWTRRE